MQKVAPMLRILASAVTAALTLSLTSTRSPV